MIGIPLEVAIHKLIINPNQPPKKQKKLLIAEVRNIFVKEEITKLLNIGSIREVSYPNWFANVVVVTKNKFRMCIY